jgi:hypothetical protein
MGKAAVERAMALDRPTLSAIPTLNSMSAEQFPVSLPHPRSSPLSALLRSDLASESAGHTLIRVQHDCCNSDQVRRLSLSK